LLVPGGSPSANTVLQSIEIGLGDGPTEIAFAA
jgi:hypothetical protein